MTEQSFLKRLSADTRGGVLIEFAILGPVLITMLLGVVQVGLGMQNYNALRSASADTARYAAVQRQKSQTLSATSIALYGNDIALGAPYLLVQDNLEVNCVAATTQRVTGATEYTLTYTYQVESFLKIIDLPSYEISYERPIFVVT